VVAANIAKDPDRSSLLSKMLARLHFWHLGDFCTVAAVQIYIGVSPLNTRKFLSNLLPLNLPKAAASSKGALRLVGVLLMVGLIYQLSGCAEGPLWRAGQYNPWVRSQWAEEEKIADTLFTRKRRMENVVAQATNASIDVQEEAALALSDIIFRDKVLLMRLHAVKLLGRLNSPTSVETLAKASKDNDKDIRLAAISAWKMVSPQSAVPQLQEIIGSDTDIDVRLAATEALGNFPGRSSVEALSLSLNDRDPALQVRAAESLQRVTGEPLGRNIVAWQEYVGSNSVATPTKVMEQGSASRTANQVPETSGDFR
jgi:hypothetical protein